MMMNVSLFPPDRMKALRMFFDGAAARVGVDGKFTIERVQPGSYELGLMLEIDDRQRVAGRALVDVVESEGLVTDDDKPAQGSWVLLVPDPPLQDDPFQSKSTNTGEYKLYASSESLTGGITDPEELRPFQEKAVKVTVSEKGRERLEIELLKPRDAQTP